MSWLCVCHQPDVGGEASTTHPHPCTHTHTYTASAASTAGARRSWTSTRASGTTRCRSPCTGGRRAWWPASGTRTPASRSGTTSRPTAWRAGWRCCLGTTARRPGPCRTGWRIGYAYVRALWVPLTGRSGAHASCLPLSLTHTPKQQVHLGLLPSSEEGWPIAARLLRPEGGWLHVHANVLESATAAWVERAEREIRELGRGLGRPWAEAGVRSHLVRVKSFAPRIWHVVLDVHCGVGVGGEL